MKHNIFRITLACSLALGISTTSWAATLNIASVSITGGTMTTNSSGSVIGPLPFTAFGPNTNLVSGYIGNGGLGISADIADPDSIVSLDFGGLPLNVYTAASNYGDNNTLAGTIPGGPMPSGALDDVAATITMNLSSWFLNWNNTDQNAGSAIATGSWNPATGEISLAWSAFIPGGPGFGTTIDWTLEGIATPVPNPAAIWLFSSGLFGLVRFSNRKQAV